MKNEEEEEVGEKVKERGKKRKKKMRMKKGLVKNPAFSIVDKLHGHYSSFVSETLLLWILFPLSFPFLFLLFFNTNLRVPYNMPCFWYRTILYFALLLPFAIKTVHSSEGPKLQ